jgi:hypothetical protein
VSPTALRRGRSAYRTFDLPQMGRQVLGADLNRPESSCERAFWSDRFRFFGVRQGENLQKIRNFFLGIPRGGGSRSRTAGQETLRMVDGRRRGGRRLAPASIGGARRRPAGYVASPSPGAEWWHGGDGACGRCVGWAMGADRRCAHGVPHSAQRGPYAASLAIRAIGLAAFGGPDDALLLRLCQPVQGG